MTVATSPRCSDVSLGRGEPLSATASSIVRWVLVEQPGPWGAAAPPQEREGAASRGLRAQAARWRARALAIRRPGRGPARESRTVLVAESRPGRERLLRHVAPDATALSELMLPADLDDPGTGWEPVPAPVFAVCTHGKHDTCCAVKGRPLAAALAAACPDQVWECSHIGGDRFAPNVVVLPHGLYLGRVLAGDAASVAERLNSGLIPQRHFRGRSCFLPAVQAAQQFAATREYGPADLPIGALPPRRIEQVGDQAFRVTLGRPDGAELLVTVERDTDPVAVRLTCHAAAERHAPVFRLGQLQVRHP